MPLLDLESIRFLRIALRPGEGAASEGVRNLDEVVDAVSDARRGARPNRPDDGHHLRVPDDAFSFAIDGLDQRPFNTRPARETIDLSIVSG